MAKAKRPQPPHAPQMQHQPLDRSPSREGDAFKRDQSLVFVASAAGSPGGRPGQVEAGSMGARRPSPQRTHGSAKVSVQEQVRRRGTFASELEELRENQRRALSLIRAQNSVAGRGGRGAGGARAAGHVLAETRVVETRDVEARKGSNGKGRGRAGAMRSPANRRREEAGGIPEATAWGMPKSPPQQSRGHPAHQAQPAPTPPGSPMGGAVGTGGLLFGSRRESSAESLGASWRHQPHMPPEASAGVSLDASLGASESSYSFTMDGDGSPLLAPPESGRFAEPPDPRPASPGQTSTVSTPNTSPLLRQQSRQLRQGELLPSVEQRTDGSKCFAVAKAGSQLSAGTSASGSGVGSDNASEGELDSMPLNEISARLCTLQVLGYASRPSQEAESASTAKASPDALLAATQLGFQVVQRAKQLETMIHHLRSTKLASVAEAAAEDAAPQSEQSQGPSKPAPEAQKPSTGYLTADTAAVRPQSGPDSALVEARLVTAQMEANELRQSLVSAQVEINSLRREVARLHRHQGEATDTDGAPEDPLGRACAAEETVRQLRAELQQERGGMVLRLQAMQERVEAAEAIARELVTKQMAVARSTQPSQAQTANTEIQAATEPMAQTAPVARTTTCFVAPAMVGGSLAVAPSHSGGSLLVAPQSVLVAPPLRTTAVAGPTLVVAGGAPIVAGTPCASPAVPFRSCSPAPRVFHHERSVSCPRQRSPLPHTVSHDRVPVVTCQPPWPPPSQAQEPMTTGAAQAQGYAKASPPLPPTRLAHAASCSALHRSETTTPMAPLTPVMVSRAQEISTL